MQAGAAGQQAGKSGNQPNHGQPGENCRVAAPGARAGQADHSDRSRPERAQGGIRGDQRSEREARRKPNQCREAPFTQPALAITGFSQIGFHSVLTWYAALNANFDPLEER